MAKLDTRCLHYFPAAIFVLLGREQILSHINQFMLDILTNNSSAENRTDLKLGRLLIYQYSTIPKVLGLKHSMVLSLVLDCLIVKTTNRLEWVISPDTSPYTMTHVTLTLLHYLHSVKRH